MIKPDTFVERALKAHREKEEQEQREADERKAMQEAGVAFTLDAVVRHLASEYDMQDTALAAIATAREIEYASWHEHTSQKKGEVLLPSVLTVEFRFDRCAPIFYTFEMRENVAFVPWSYPWRLSRHGSGDGWEKLPDTIVAARRAFEERQAREAEEDAEQETPTDEGPKPRRCPLQQEDCACGSWCAWWRNPGETGMACRLIVALERTADYFVS